MASERTSSVSARTTFSPRARPPDGPDQVEDLELEGIVLVNLHVLHERRAPVADRLAVERVLLRGATVDADVLLGVVEDDVRLRLRDRQHTDLLLGGATRGDEGDRAGLEADLHVGDVGRGGVDRRPHRGEPPRRRVDQAQHDVEVVDHQIHHHAVLLHPRGERSQTPRFDEDRALHDLLQLLHRAVEPLDVPDVQHGAAPAGDREELARLLERRGDRLLDENADAGLEQVGGDLEVLLGRHGDAREIDLADQLVVVGQRLRVVVGRDLLGAIAIDIDDPDQVDVPQLRVGEHVVLPHVAGAHDTSAQPALVPGSYRHHTGSLSALGTPSATVLPGSAAPQIPRRDPAMNSSIWRTGPVARKLLADSLDRPLRREPAPEEQPVRVLKQRGGPRESYRLV